MTDKDHDSEQISDNELRRRVIYSVLLPAVKLAYLFNIPLKELLGWVETAYFHEVRSTGATLKETSQTLKISQRTAVRLSKQLRESFFLPEVKHNLPRRIEFMLWTQPMSEARLVQVLRDVEPEKVREALVALQTRGRIVEKQGRTLMYETRANLRRLPRDTWMARIGGLNSLMENVTNTIYGRFFHNEERAFARTLSFQMPATGLGRLKELYEAQLLPRLKSISDDAVPGDEEGFEMQLTLCWAPYEYTSQMDSDQGDTT
ncbi:MAG: hypothetical protein AAFS10_01985 [Myxococcota bacterium]